MAMTSEQRISYIEGKLDSLATKADVAEVRGEVRAMRWTIAVVGVGISIVILATNLIG
jgi:hypothetical protein